MSNQEIRLPNNVKFGYQTLRTISSPDDINEERKVFAGNAPASSYLDIPENENVRDYLLNAPGRKTKRTTEVHREIRDTLSNRPNLFPVLNSGITIVCRGATVDDKNRTISLLNPSIINGSQTRGELRHYLESFKDREQTPYNVHCKFEIIVTTDDELIAEISISRNFQNDVARLSIAGRREQLNELEASIQNTHPDFKLRKKETQFTDDFYDTEKLIQVITALIPNEIWMKEKESKDPRKTYTYSGKSKCLKEFQQLHSDVKAGPPQDNKDKSYEKKLAKYVKNAALYKFFLDIAPTAYELYEAWKSHNGFKGSALRSIDRSNSGKIIRVPDGILFPILASLSAFIKSENGVWIYSPPSSFSDEDIIQAAVSQYKDTAKSNPTTMGKTQSIYSSLYQITSIFKRLAQK